MKKISLLLLLLGATATAQEVYLETGTVSSSFKFKNNEGVMLENLQPKTRSYVAAGFKHQLLTDGLNVTTGLSYNTYGAIGSDDTVNNFFEWELDYLGINLGLDYELFRSETLAFYVLASGSAEFILNGTQTLNSSVIDVTQTEEFKDIAMFLRGGGGIRFKLSDVARIYLQYLYGGGLVLDDNNNSQVTELNINTHSVGIGVLINLPKREKDEMQDESETNQSEN